MRLLQFEVSGLKMLTKWYLSSIFRAAHTLITTYVYCILYTFKNGKKRQLLHTLLVFMLVFWMKGM